MTNFTSYTESAFGSLLVTNNYGIVSGSDDETDDNYRYRIQLKIQSPNGANEAALRFQILLIPGIQDVVFSPAAGTFTCYVYGIASDGSSALLQSVQTALNDNIAFPLTGIAVAPDLVGISLTTTITLTTSLSPVDQQTVISNAITAVENYINNLGIGDELVINDIADQILNADPNILDVGSPNQPLGSILIWRSRTDGTRYSRFLQTDYTPALDEQIIVERQHSESDCDHRSFLKLQSTSAGQRILRVNDNVAFLFNWHCGGARPGGDQFGLHVQANRIIGGFGVCLPIKLFMPVAGRLYVRIRPVGSTG